jgi:hypothetical protein
MNWTGAFRFATAVIASLGGGGALVFGLSSYLGRLWAHRALEQEKHKYADMLQTAKGELDKATNRYQVQLDALGHIHRLRTDEEFSRLAQLWKKMAILQNAFQGAAGLGFMLVPADPVAAKEYREVLRKEYEEALWAARNFFSEERLFIPRSIADCAEATLRYSINEKNFYDIFSKHHETEVRRQYTDHLPEFMDNFNNGIGTLESMMREHIEGKRLAS